MTNLIPIEALNHFLEGDYTEEHKKKIRRIKQALESYEARDLLLSCWNYDTRGEHIIYHDRKRFVKYANKLYPFTQSSPKILVCWAVNNKNFAQYILEQYYKDTWMVKQVVKFEYLESFFPDEKWFFFCNKEYTKQIGIEPHVVENYYELVEKYINYIKWKIGAK